MQDRISKYPGRIKLNPVDGQENVYDMERADEPTQEGHPLSAATLLRDATAALFDQGGNATPDDIFALLADHITGAVKFSTGTYRGAPTDGIGNAEAPTSLTFSFKPSFVVVAPKGKDFAPVMFYRSNTQAIYQNPNKHELGFCKLVVKWADNGVSWYASSYKYYATYGDSTETVGDVTAAMQLCAYGTEYAWFALGR